LATPPTPHLEALLQHDINVIRTKLLEMVALDEQALTRAFQAFLGRDRQLAYSVILRDQDVDALETELDRLCVEFMVRHQPVAGHLRFIYSASKIIGELERVGDYAESVARQVLLISSIPFEVRTDRFHEIVNLAVPMLHNAVRAFLERNSDLARATMANQPRVNQVRDQINAELLEWRQQGTLPLEALTPMVTVARRFERVSDRATNICEQALYFTTGEYHRHMPREGFRVLFVDAANGCLSRIAEAIGSRLGARRFLFSSAGILAGAVDPQTVRFLAEKGIDISPQASRSIDQVPQLDQMEVMVALCDAAEQAFPRHPTKMLGLRWSVPDPCKAGGTPAEVRAEYEQAYQTLTGHIRDLVQAILGNDEISTNEETTPPI
jgi:phosphate transport system protein